MAIVDYAHRVAFPKLIDAEVEVLAARATVYSFEDGEAISLAGQRGLPFYVIESGEIAIVDDSTEPPRMIAVHGRHEFTGDVSLITGRHPGLRQGAR